MDCTDCKTYILPMHMPQACTPMKTGYSCISQLFTLFIAMNSAENPATYGMAEPLKPDCVTLHT